MGHGRQQGRLGGPRPRARAHHLRLGRRVRRVLRGAVEDLHSRGMYFIEKYVLLCVSAGYLLHLGGGGAEELYVPRPDDLLVLQQRLHREEISRYCHEISNCKNII